VLKPFNQTEVIFYQCLIYVKVDFTCAFPIEMHAAFIDSKFLQAMKKPHAIMRHPTLTQKINDFFLRDILN